jgi:hypothetical protein
MVPWSQLALLSPAERGAHDCAAVNLACAAGLPGAEDLDVPHCLAVLDAWAGRGGRETERCAGQFQAEPARSRIRGSTSAS